MRRSHPVVFFRGFIEAVAAATAVCAALACSDDDAVIPISSPAAGGGGALPDAGVNAEPPEVALPSVLAERVSALFERSCVECHANGMARGGLGDLPALTTLLESGQIVPGASAASPLMALLRSDHVSSTQNRARFGEIALVARFIDELPALEEAPCEPLDLVDRDAELAMMLADASGLGADVLPFTRYITLSYASNAGACGAALERERYALSAIVNGASTAAEVRRPVPIDERALIYRIDIRDYGWNRPLDLEDDGSVDVGDGWRAITAAASDYALPFDGPEADELERLTQSRAPHLAANALLAVASRGDVYYTLTGQDGALYDTETRLGIDIDRAIADGDVSRAGFSGGERGRNELVVMRFGQASSSPLAYWLLADFGDETRGGSIYADPLDYSPPRVQTMFHLPNGMLAFASGDANWSRVQATPATCQRCIQQRGGLVAAGCRGCHHTGLVPLQDELRTYVEENRAQFDPQSFEAILAQYPVRSEMDQTLAADGAIYLTALDRAGVPRGVPDPISAVYFDFERPLTSRRAAAELGVARAELEDSLDGLDGPLQILAIGGARVARADFAGAYRNALCLLLGPARNQPEGCAVQP